MMKRTLLALPLLLLVCSCDEAAEQKKQLEAAEKAAKELTAMAEKHEAAAKEIEKAVEKNDPANPQDLAAAMNQMKKVMEAQGANVDPVNFRDLKALLPEKVEGMDRKKHKGEKTAAGGVKVSSAEARYKGKDAQIDLKVMDMGTMKGFGALAVALPGVEIDRETDDGYEKTTKFMGYSAMEKYSKSRKKAELRLFVEGRFVVEADGKNVEMKTLKAAVEAIDIKKLASMKDQGVKK